MIRLLTGDNNFEIKAARMRVIAEFKRKHGPDAVTIVDGSTLTREELPQLLLGASLFATEKLVVIDDAAGVKDAWEKLGEYLPQVDETTDVLLVTGSADKRTKTYKWLQKNANVRELDNLQGFRLEKWLQAYAKEKGIELKAPTARFMIDYAGADQSRLSFDIEKLALSGREVDETQIRELLIPNPQSSAFDLLDAALSGKRELLDNLLEGVRTHEDPYRFFGLLANQIFAITVCGAAGNRPADTIAKDTGLHPFVVKKTQPLAKRLSAPKRNRLVEIAATTDTQLKSSGIEPWVLITAALKSMVA